MIKFLRLKNHKPSLIDNILIKRDNIIRKYLDLKDDKNYEFLRHLS